MMTLALLLTAAMSAWAESKPIGLNVEYAAGDEITSTTDVYVYYGEQPSTSKQMVVKITSTQPLKIFMITAHSFELNGDAEVYYMPSGESTGGYAGGIPCLGESTGDETVVHVASGSGTLTDPYVFGSGPSGTPVPLTRGTGEKINEWTLTNGMPAGNVTVKVKYFPQAAFAMSTDATPVALAPKASTSARANTDDPLVEGGTVAGIVDGEAMLEEGQGTLLYHFSAKQLDADALQALTAADWTDKVPTADGLAEGTVYVYYYIKGADDLPGITPGAKFTFSDSDIQELAVTLGAEPTYDVEFAEGTNPEAPAEPIWTATPNTGVKKGQTVTVTYSGDRKVIAVKAEKKSAEKTITIGEQNYTVLNGETWKQFITRNQLSGWTVAQYTDTTWYVYKNKPSYKLRVKSDGNNWVMLELTSEDAPIDTDKQYTLGYD